MRHTLLRGVSNFLLQSTLPSYGDVEFAETSDQLTNIWEDFLHKSHLRIEIALTTSLLNVDSNSLLDVCPQSRIRRTFAIVIRLAELLTGNIVAEMARQIQAGLAVEAIDQEGETEHPDRTSMPIKVTKFTATD